MDSHEPVLRFGWKLLESDFCRMFLTEYGERCFRDSTSAPANPAVPLPAPDIGFRSLQDLHQFLCLEAAEEIGRLPQSP
ncbi:MAG TPA: hypothetical protein DCY80_09590 [Solibacterales bacterium]|nr:hypothetical protein [Bryobacterales bacterium]